MSNFCFVDPVRITPPMNGTKFYVTRKQSLTIKCLTDGAPPPRGSWARVDPFDFPPPPPPSSPSPEILYFPTVQNGGKFQCFASNVVIRGDYSRTEHTAVMTVEIVATW